jgi:hypothetical protein
VLQKILAVLHTQDTAVREVMTVRLLRAMELVVRKVSRPLLKISKPDTVDQVITETVRPSEAVVEEAVEPKTT